MSHFDVAHIREQGVDLIIVPLDVAFSYKSNSEMATTKNALQAHARAAGLAGTVVPVWENAMGGTEFLAPQSFHPFFRSIGMSFVQSNINKRLNCS
jgi:hypothetical protein